MFKADQGCSHTFWWIYIVIGALLEERQHLHLQEKVQYKYFGQYNIGHHLLSEWSGWSGMVWVSDKLSALLSEWSEFSEMVWDGLGGLTYWLDLLTEWSEWSEMVWNGLGCLSGLEWSGWSDLLLDLLTEWSEWSGMVWVVWFQTPSLISDTSRLLSWCQTTSDC